MDTVIAPKHSEIDLDNINLKEKSCEDKVLLSKPLIFETSFMRVMGPVKSTDYPNVCKLFTSPGDMIGFIDHLESIIIDLVTSVGESWFSSNDVTYTSMIGDSKGVDYLEWNVFRDLFDHKRICDEDSVKLTVKIEEILIRDNTFFLVPIVHKVSMKRRVRYEVDDFADGEELALN